MDELAEARKEGSDKDGKAVFWFQLYLARDPARNERVIKKALE
jgi:hypothetical protein